MIYQLIGICLFVVAFSHKLESAHQLEPGIIKFLQVMLNRPPYLGLFRELWFLGRTTFTVIVLVLMIGFNWKLGLSALAVFCILAGLEKAVKTTCKRERPFSVHDDIQMLQPWEPVDPSFPSGDALRIWFLALILTIALGNNPLFGVLAALLGVLVSLGRMVFGVHFLTDVLAGAGLGFLGAGTTIWLWRLLHLL